MKKRRRPFANISLDAFFCPRCAHPTLYATTKGHRTSKFERHKTRRGKGIIYAVRCRQRGCGWASPVCDTCLLSKTLQKTVKVTFTGIEPVSTA